MSAEAAAAQIFALGFDGPRLEDLTDAGSLRELCASIEALSGVPARVASLTTPAPDEAPRDGAVTRAFTAYYDGDPVARIELGPYVPEGTDAPGDARPRASEAQIARLAEHARAVLDLLLSSGHKVGITSTLHLAAMQEGHRELAAKTAQLDEALSRLTELERLKANFLATVSHELRTPLTSIIGYSEMLAEGIGGQLSQEQHDFVQTVRGKSVQLLELIMNLLDLSKLESGAAALAYADVPLNDVVAEVVAQLAPGAAKKGVAIDVTPCEQAPRVLGDMERMRQIVRHLVENAIKFTRPGDAVRIAIRAVTQRLSDDIGYALLAPLRQAVEMRVADTGPGIPEEERARIFDPFFQVDQSSTREHGGAGLGLTIVRRLVEAHGGSIQVESAAPQGAVFVVTLPRPRGASTRPPDDA